MRTPSHTQPTSPTREAAFTLIEIIVVLVIVAILMAAAIITFGGAKSSAYYNEGVSTGSAYQQAISSYAGDHANRTPTVASLAGDNAKKGPLNLLNKPYINSMPESVSNGRSLVVASVDSDGNCSTSFTAPAGTQLSTVSLCFESPTGDSPNFYVRIIARKNTGSAWTEAAGAKMCFMGSTALEPRC